MSPNMRLVDRADGNKGRFCIARDSVLSGAPYCEYYQEEGGWSSAGTVYVGEKWATERMNQIKEFEESLLFPKKEQMTNAEYVSDALKTEPADYEAIGRRACQYIRELHAVIGLATEAGEMLDALKKAIFYGKPLDRTNLIEEDGDVCWYRAVLADSQGYTFDESMEKNVAKLRARYGEKFTSEAAINRDLEKERSILEGK